VIKQPFSKKKRTNSKWGDRNGIQTVKIHAPTTPKSSHTTVTVKKGQMNTNRN